MAHTAGMWVLWLMVAALCLAPRPAVSQTTPPVVAPTVCFSLAVGVSLGVTASWSLGGIHTGPPADLFTRDTDLKWPRGVVELSTDKASALTREQFMRTYVLGSQAVVLRGAARQWMDLDELGRSPAELAKRYGRAEVEVELAPDRFFHQAKDGFRVLRPVRTLMSFRDFLGRMERGEYGEETLHGETRLHMAIEQIEMRDQLPDLAKLVRVPPIASSLELLHKNFWYAPRDKVSILHHDQYENLLCVVRGAKTVRLFSPEQTPLLYPSEMHEYHLETGDHGVIRTTHSSDLVSNFSPVNVTHPDLGKYPLFAQANGTEVVLNEGDALFLPAFWWHQVTSRGGKHGHTVAVNLWFSPVSPLAGRLWRVLLDDMVASPGAHGTWTQRLWQQLQHSARVAWSATEAMVQNLRRPRRDEADHPADRDGDVSASLVAAATATEAADWATEFGTVLQRISAIKESHPSNLAIKYFDEGYFRDLTRDQQVRLLRIIKSGIDHPNSVNGFYAMNTGDYAEFEAYLDQCIRAMHRAAPDAVHVTDWDVSDTGDGGVLDVTKLGLSDLSMRVRVARNLAQFSLPGAMDRAERIRLETTMLEVFAKLQAMPEHGGTVYSLSPDLGGEPNPNLISVAKYEELVRAHVMFKDMSADPYLVSAGIAGDWPYGRGCWQSGDKQCIIWFGEEDHLRIMCLKTGTRLDEVFGRLKRMLDVVESIQGVQFARSDKYGYITSCPTNLGTAMRASVHVKLPNLTSDGTDAKAKAVCKPLGLSVRGLGGEHTPIGEDGTVDISPSARLFIKEKEIVAALYTGIERLMVAERRAAEAPRRAGGRVGFASTSAEVEVTSDASTSN